MTDLRTLRASLGLSQPKFARLLGTPYHTYRGWETGRKSPPPIVGVVGELLRRYPGPIGDMLKILAVDRELAIQQRRLGMELPAPPDAP